MKTKKTKRRPTPSKGYWGRNAEERLRLRKKYEEVSLTELTPWKENPRFNEDAVPRVAALIKEHGWAGTIVATPDGVIRAGHTRYAAVMMLGWKTVPVHWRNFPSKQAAEDYALADNKSGEWADWDSAKLRKLFANRSKVNPVALERSTGFQRQEIDWIQGPGEGTDGEESPAEQPLAFPKWMETAARYGYTYACRVRHKRPKTWALIKDRELTKFHTWFQQQEK